MKTYSPKKSEIEREWFVVDAEGLTLGRMSTEIARILRGKHKPTFAPHMDMGDHVIVVNADKVKLTSNKADRKLVHHHSGYPGGLTTRTYQESMDRRPADTVRKSITGMLPKNRLGNQMATKLKVYAGPTHPHGAQMPSALKIPGARRESRATAGRISPPIASKHDLPLSIVDAFWKPRMYAIRNDATAGVTIDSRSGTDDFVSAERHSKTASVTWTTALSPTGFLELCTSLGEPLRVGVMHDGIEHGPATPDELRAILESVDPSEPIAVRVETNRRAAVLRSEVNDLPEVSLIFERKDRGVSDLLNAWLLESSFPLNEDAARKLSRLLTRHCIMGHS